MKKQQTVTISEEEYEKLKLESDLYKISTFLGSSKRKTTEEEYERVREEVAQEICKKFKITQLKDKYCLDDIASNIIESRNKAMYFFKIEEKEKIGKKYYVSKERFKTILKYAKSSNAKKAFDMLTDEKQNSR